MEDHVIETSIDELIQALKEKGKMNVSEAADFLKMTQKQIEPILNTLEENSIIEIKYPVIGEPKIILKPNAPERIEIRKSQIKEAVPEIAEERTIIERPTISEKVEMKPEIKSEETEIVNKKMEKLENEIFDLSNKVDTTIFKEDLSEILLIIAGLRNIEKISFYLKEVLSIIHKMKEKSIWTDEDRDLVTTMLKDISENWKEYGNMEIANLFDEIKGKIETA
jgi:DNA-binding Lrp family transcriptional regulator